MKYMIIVLAVLATIAGCDANENKVESYTIKADKCLPDTKPGCVGLDLKALSNSTYRDSND